MKTKIIPSVLLLGACFWVSIPVFAQANTTTQPSIQTTPTDVNQQRNQDLLTQEKQQQQDTKAIAKETRRKNNEAASAAKESRKAFDTEKRAQRMRKKADKQAAKAEAAVRKSTLN